MAYFILATLDAKAKISPNFQMGKIFLVQLSNDWSEHICS